MNRSSAAVALATFVSLAAPSPAFSAGPYDPEVDYFTLETPHFYVVFPKGYDAIALRSARIAEATWPYLAKRYDWEPAGRISIVVNDQTDFANGFASIVPNKLVTVFVTAPTRVSGLEDYDDWLATLIQHELAHIFHLDMAYGLPWVGRQIFGKYVAMNSYNAAWSTEGLAVYEESVISGAGRGRSHYVDMVLRVAALEDRFPPIDQGYRGYPRWPFSNVAYFFGGRFQLFLKEHYGEKALLDYHRAYAANPIPYFTYLPAKLKFDTSLESLWLAYEDETKAEAQRIVDLIHTSTLAVTQPERLTFHGGESVGPRFTPDGKHVVYSTSSPIDGPRVRRLELASKSDEPLVNDTLSQSITFSPDGSAFYYQQTEINQRFYQHNSVLRYDIAKESISKINLDENDSGDFRDASGSLRIRDPDLSPDGKRIVVVQNRRGQNRLLLAWIESDGTTIHPKVIVPADGDVQYSNPRFSPTGDRIAVTRFRGGRRDVIIVDLDGVLTHEITRDRAQDTDPTWTPDGRFVVFASDRTGVYNLYAYELATKAVRQQTNLITGAFQPSVSPDGASIIFRGYSADGFDVYRVPFSSGAGVRVEIEKEPEVVFDRRERNWPLRHPDAPELPGTVPQNVRLDQADLPEGWTVDSYSALDTILPFNDNWNLFPALTANEREIFGSLTHFGTDARQTHAYLLQLTYGTFTKFVGGGASYVYNELEPSFAVIASADARTFSRSLFVEGDPAQDCALGGQIDLQDGRRVCFGSEDGLYNERRLAAQFSIGLPVLQRHFFSLSYIYEHRAALDALPTGTLTGALPRRGRFARVRLGYTYANVRAFPFSVSLERGPSFGVALSALSRGLGSEYEQMLLTAEGRYYIDLPYPVRWLNNHVLAGRLAIGVGAGPDPVEIFRMGGSAGQSALTTTTDNFYPLRGIDTAALNGVGLINGSLEYRAPLFRVDRGIGTLPFTLRVVHAALFADFGRMFDEISVAELENDFFGGFALGVGAEVRANVILAYALPLTLRLGYAHAAVVPNTLDPDVDTSNGFYFQLGSTF